MTACVLHSLLIVFEPSPSQRVASTRGWQTWQNYRKGHDLFIGFPASRNLHRAASLSLVLHDWICLLSLIHFYNVCLEFTFFFGAGWINAAEICLMLLYVADILLKVGCQHTRTHAHIYASGEQSAACWVALGIWPLLVVFSAHTWIGVRTWATLRWHIWERVPSFRWKAPKRSA